MVPEKTLGARTASPEDSVRIVSMMTLGFADDTVCRRLFPDPTSI